MTVVKMSVVSMAAMLLAAPAVAQDAAAGKALFAPCVACHGENGEGNKDMNAPAIGGQEGWYVARQLANFKSGVRGADAKDTFGMQMKPMADTLADEAAIKNVAAYVASLRPAKPAATLGGDAAAGEAIYQTCAACHGADAGGQEAMNAPSLRNQHDWYLARQLQHFKDGVRGTNAKDTFGAQMKPMAETLVDEAAAKNVIAYIVSR